MKIQTYKAGDEHEILELFKLSFKQEMELDFWKWRFKNNPIGEPMIYLMWDGPKLVGHYAVSPNLMSVEGKNYKSALSMTTMTHPEYGGKGIFTQLAAALYETEHKKGNLDIVFGFPNRLSHRGFIKNLAWKNNVVIPNFSLLTEEFRFKSTTDSSEFQLIENLEQAHVKKYENLVADYNIHAVKDQAYYNWRYNQNPENTYAIFAHNDGDFCVVKAFGTGEEIELDIVEWTVDNEPNKMKNLFNSIYTFFESKGQAITKFNSWLPLNDPRHINFELLGFAHREHLTFMGHRAMNTNLKMDCKDWFYQMSDSDVY